MALVVKVVWWLEVTNLIEAIPKIYSPGLLLADVFAASMICLSVFSSISSTLLVSSTSKSRGETVVEMVAAVEAIDAFEDPASTLMLATLVAAVKGVPAAGEGFVSGAAAAAAGVGPCCGGGGGGRFAACLQIMKIYANE